MIDEVADSQRMETQLVLYFMKAVRSAPAGANLSFAQNYCSRRKALEHINQRDIGFPASAVDSPLS